MTADGVSDDLHEWLEIDGEVLREETRAADTSLPISDRVALASSPRSRPA